MGEPLKGKIIKDIDPSFDFKMFHLKDVKLAVEWLKDNLEKLDSTYVKTNMTDAGYSLAVIGLINKAFPDLNTPNSNKARKE